MINTAAMVQCCQHLARKGFPIRYTQVTRLLGYNPDVTRCKRSVTVPSKFCRNLHNHTSICHQSTRRLSSAAGRSKPQVTVDPGGHLLVDDELHICVRGLEGYQEVTIHTVIRDSGKSIESCCQFRADGNGVVDLYNHPSLSGSYSGVSSMGIFWSMSPTADMQKGFRLIVKDMENPIKAEVNVYIGKLTVDEIQSMNLEPATSHSIDRWYKGQGVTSTDVTDGRLRGRLFLPSGPGPFPGVIDLFGTVGGITEFRAALLASRGIASLALPYFLYKDLPKTLFEIELEYFLEAVSWLRNHPKVYGEGVGVIGTSKGGDIGYMMATNCPEVRALVNINGCTFNANYPMKYSGGDIPAVEMNLEKMKMIDDAGTFNETFEYSEKDLFPVWRYNPKILNILAEDDQCGPNQCIRLMEQIYPKDKVDNFTVLSYPEAGHLLEPPYTPCCRMSYHKSFGMYFLWGGQPKPHADAQEHAWKSILKFFHTHIPKTTS